MSFYKKKQSRSAGIGLQNKRIYCKTAYKKCIRPNLNKKKPSGTVGLPGSCMHNMKLTTQGNGW